jgi:site-specific DNA-adenine methylase
MSPDEKYKKEYAKDDYKRLVELFRRIHSETMVWELSNQKQVDSFKAIQKWSTEAISLLRPHDNPSDEEKKIAYDLLKIALLDIEETKHNGFRTEYWTSEAKRLYNVKEK